MRLSVIGIGWQSRRFLGNEVNIRSGLGWMHAQRPYLSQSTSLKKAVIPSSPTPHLHTLYKRAKLIHNRQTSGVPVNQNQIQYVSVGLSGQGTNALEARPISQFSQRGSKIANVLS